MNKSLRILHLEDDPDYSDVVRTLLEEEGLDVEILLVCSRQDYEVALVREQFDLVLADFQMPDYSGLKALQCALEKKPGLPFVLLSGTIGEQEAIECLRAGATDYVLKLASEKLGPTVRRAVQEAKEKSERRRVEGELAEHERFFRALTENTLDLFLIVDGQGVVLYVSPSVKSLLGYEPAELASTVAFERVHADDLSCVLEAFERVLGDESLVLRLQFRVRTADGNWRYLEAVARNRLSDTMVQGVIINARDVTDRRASECRLAESERQYRLIFDGNPTPMWIFDHDTLEFLEVNDAAVQHYGYSRDEFLSMTLKDIRASAETPSPMEYMHRLVLGEGSARLGYGGVWEHKKKDGSKIDVEIKWSPITFQGRSASLTMVNDITDRKKREHREAALSKLGQLLSCATSAAEAAAIIRSIAESLFHWDAFTLDLYSDKEDLITPLLNVDTSREGQQFETTLSNRPHRPSEMARRVLEHGAQIILREEPLSIPDGVLPMGEICRPSASLLLAPIPTRSRVIGVLSVQSYTVNAYTPHDLGVLQTLADHCGGALERIDAEAALKQSELLFHSIWQNSLDGMRLVDGQGRIVAVNEPFCRMVSMRSEELQDQPYTVIYSTGERPAERLQQFQHAFEERRVDRQAERRVTLHNGANVILEERSVFVDVPGQAPLVLTVLRDITAGKRLEDQFRQAQKMEAIGQLAGGVAHDFNNILTVIHGHASLLKVGAGLPESVVSSASQIVHAADRAAGLTRQLLTFSRRQVIQAQSLDLNEVVGNMTKMLGRILGEDIELHLSYFPQPATVEADAGMIEQVLLNLAVNSRDAMPGGGVLKIRISTRSVGEGDIPDEPEAVAGDFFCISVTDTGCGIPPDVIPRIFEPFFTTKQVGKGTGLGLATVYGIVKQHQGWLQVRSEVGRGTIFRVYLPRARVASVAAQSPQEASPVRGGQETILVVEDEEPVRELVCHLLGCHGYQVLQAESGVKALEVWREAKSRIQLLLTDLVMPDRMNGRELAEKLWTERPGLKVIFTSGYSADVVGRDFVARAGLQYLQKPYPPHKLATVVRDCLDSKA